MSTEAIEALIEWADNFPNQTSTHYDLIARAGEELTAIGEDRRGAAATELLDAVEALLSSEPKSYWLRGPVVRRLRSAYNTVVALAAAPEPQKE